MKHMFSLDGKWSCSGITPEGKTINITASVPCSVHMALIDAGIIKDLYVEDNALKYQWVEQCIWEFKRTFVIEDVKKDMNICFEGLDVYCDILINDIKIGSTDNMFIEHSFHIGNVIKEGGNTIKIVFYPPDSRVKECPERSAAFGNWTRVYTRRIQCTYGWDWVERFVTCGIVRSVYLYCDDKTELDHIYVYTNNIDEYSAQVKMEIRFKAVGENTWLHMEIYDPDAGKVYEDRKLIVEQDMYKTVDIVGPQLWYPNGYGEQKLYHIILEVLERDTVLSVKDIKFGIHTIKILQKQDLPGSTYYNKCLEIQDTLSFSQDIKDFEKNTEFFGFIVLVNEIPIMCKGANWVPCDPIRFAGNGEKIKRLLQLAGRAGLNMLRVWGGGVFEEDIFYEECDRLGILVVQDFLMACASYPCDEEWFCTQLEKEAVFAVKKLRNHACLAWWNGDNENAAGGNDNQKAYDGRKVVRGVIMPILKRYDYMHEVFPSSPYGGDRYASITSGTTHNTQFMSPKYIDVRIKDMNNYEDYFDIYLSRFDSEEPVMGAPSLSSLRRFMTDEEIFGKDITMWRYHTRNNPCGEFLNYDLFQYHKIFAEKLLGPFRNIYDRLLKLQYIQYELVRKTMELYRRNKWFSAGIIYWMFNDEWPASGWSLIDYFGVPKAGYYAFANTAQPVIASVKHENRAYCVYICNDCCKTAEGHLTVTAQNFKDKVHSWTCQFVSESNTSCVVLEIPDTIMDIYTDKTSVLLCDTVSDLGEHHTRYYMSKPANVSYPEANIEILKQDSEKITLIADAYVPVVKLEGDCIFEDNYFDLRKDVPKTIRLISAAEKITDNIEIKVLSEGRKNG